MELISARHNSCMSAAGAQSCPMRLPCRGGRKDWFDGYLAPRRARFVGFHPLQRRSWSVYTPSGYYAVGACYATTGLTNDEFGSTGTVHPHAFITL